MTKPKPTTLPIGELTPPTETFVAQACDLLDVARELDLEPLDKDDVRRLGAELTEAGDEEPAELRATAEEVADRLASILERYLPPYCFLDESPSAGYAVSPDPDGAQDSPDVVTFDAGDEPRYVMVVSDHGNPTLYEITYSEVWAAV